MEFQSPQPSLIASLGARVDLPVLAESVLAAMGDGVSIQDRDYRVLYQNRAHQRIVAGSFLGEICYRVYAHRSSPCPGCAVVKALADGRVHRQLKPNQPGRPATHVEIIASPITDSGGEYVAAIEIVRDVSGHRQALEQVQQLNRDLQRQAEELAAANRELETFSYSISHDLRSPLTQVRMAAEALEAGLGKEIDAERAFFLATLIGGVDQMSQLLDSMMALSRVSLWSLDIQPVDLSELVQEILLGLQLREPGRKVETRLAPDLTAWGDRALLRTALQNLLENAWKYSAPRRRARIEFGRCSSGENEGAFFVRDNGIGFAMAEADQVFIPFRRLAPSQGFRGSGIGLTTCQRVIERHGGRIWAKASPGRGATFFFSLPLPGDT